MVHIAKTSTALTARAKARRRHVTKYYVEVISDTTMRVLSRSDYEYAKKDDPVKFKNRKFIEFNSLNDAMNHVSRQFGFTCMPAAHA